MAEFQQLLDEPMSGTAPNASSLLGGIVSDVHDLLDQQLSLVRHELRKELRMTCRASWLVSAGVGAVSLSIVVLVFGVVHLLSWFFPALPLWGSFALVGIALAAVAAAMIYRGIQVFNSVQKELDETVQALKGTR